MWENFRWATGGEGDQREEAVRWWWGWAGGHNQGMDPGDREKEAQEFVDKKYLNSLMNQAKQYAKDKKQYSIGHNF